MNTSQDYDYIVVGGGSAGCVLANRLSADPAQRVLLIEAGPHDNSIFIRMPAGFSRVFGTQRMWDYQSEPQRGLGGRKPHVPQGRTLGGSGSMNGMIYIRGDRQDYYGWRDAGCDGWGYDDVLPWFRKSEGNARLSDTFHGAQGPLKVMDTPYRHPLNAAFVRSAQEVGLPFNHDFNGASQLGAGFYQITAAEGERGNTSRFYLRPAKSRPNLEVRTDLTAARVLFEGTRATGIECVESTGSHATVRFGARREVVLCAGGLGSAKLLLQSGVGPGAQAQALGIPVVRDLPGVGRNYQDHLEVPVYGKTREPISLFGQDKGLSALRHGAQWVLFKSGLMTSNVVESGGFFDLDGDGRADVQFHVLPVLVGDVGREPPMVHGITLNPCQLAPKSRGELRLRSKDPLDLPWLDAGALADEDDVRVLREGVRLARRILRAPSLAALVSEEIEPVPELAGDDDATIDARVRHFVKTVYHPGGTCKMGIDREAVVDPQLRVHGLQGLRVADVSVMPAIPRGNTNAGTIMVAERAAHFIQSQGA
ncbi:GMC family oxidoreductase [Pseudorhodoferax sp. Leaf267]|uniref:GMC family oxidoreductase n=1 Tax=Pseudorhodoferax sp. Leaf267 TaxID=1736316 RepID=UPI0006F711B4|nr:GMC family oxidoreductase N-terminal domain-containing protein [Pseudorhodoferax sp. Leaf267]KQP23408.1 GMC family oxidoreductase [Pseudorhodoferax sp. Leaf267]